MSGRKQRVLFIANGNGEDSIAAAIIAKLPNDVAAEAYPLVGAGGVYQGLCPIVGPRSQVPSEGWRHTSGSVIRDVKGGMLQSIFPALKFLRAARNNYDKVVAVGDAVTPLLARIAGLPIDIYLDVFKSGYAHHYSAPERWLIRSIAKKTYCRDDMLASALREAGVNALSAGNVMLDTVPYGTYDATSKREQKLAIALLPGSREWTSDALKLQIAALKKLPTALTADLFVAVAGSIDVGKLAIDVGMSHQSAQIDTSSDLGTLSGGGLVLHLATGVIGNLIEQSDLVLSQAGTATQQALGMGKPVITFNRADNRPKRMADEQALMGEARILTSPEVDALARAIEGLLSNKREMQRLGAIGQTRLGGPGTLQAVIADLVV